MLDKKHSKETDSLTFPQVFLEKKTGYQVNIFMIFLLEADDS